MAVVEIVVVTFNVILIDCLRINYAYFDYA